VFPDWESSVATPIPLCQYKLTSRQFGFTIFAMSALSPQNSDADKIWNRYRHNFSRHLLGVARHLQSSMMDTLQEQCGHENLRLGFSPYITLIGEGDKRLTDLAELLGISRQACNQAAKQVAAAGYIERKADPLDGRAKLLALSPKGIKLRRDGVRIVAQLDQQFADIVGDAQIADTSRSLRKINGSLSLARTPEGNPPAARAVMGGLLPRLADYILQRLMELTSGKGHPGLKLCFGQVLTLIGPSGGRIQQMAAAHDVSKQAISAIATELEELGYLQRDTDPVDARQIVLTFTTRGETLIADSVISVGELEAEFAAIIGQAAFKRLGNTLHDLYRGLGLEQEIFEKSGPADIGLLAHQLQQQLGEQGSRALARLLLSPSV
jgi:DNA-binding MarR family transcriptional regulator